MVDVITEVNMEVLLANLRGFATRGFSGDLLFRRVGREVARRVDTVYMPERERQVANPVAALESVEAYWSSVVMWLECLSTDNLQVRMSNGKITKVRSWEGGGDGWK